MGKGYLEQLAVLVCWGWKEGGSGGMGVDIGCMKQSTINAQFFHEKVYLPGLIIHASASYCLKTRVNANNPLHSFCFCSVFFFSFPSKNPKFYFCL